MNLDQKIQLIKQVGEEIITEEELKELLETKSHPIAYDGFEPSGNVHIAQGILRSININKMTKAGCKFKMWVADWFGWMNDKMGGDLENIQAVGQYMIEVWKASGMDIDNVEFVWSHEAMSNVDYWKKVVKIARMSSVPRIIRCAQIMGRAETDKLSAAQIFYPCMQAADIFHLEADITQLGMDQRKVNMLAREIAPRLGFTKPVVVSHHMLMGLGVPPSTDLKGSDRAIELKMSKSKPDSAIFMTDSSEDIKRKIAKAYCPEGIVEENPVMEYCRYILFEKYPVINIERPKKFGGDVEFKEYDELKNAFEKKEIHPMDLKNTVARYVDELVEPIRLHFEKNQKARDLLERMKSFEVTR